MIPSLNQALETAGLSSLVDVLAAAEVDMEVFLFLTDRDLNHLGIKVGPRRKLLNLQQQLRDLHGIVMIEEEQDSEDDGSYGEDDNDCESDDQDDESDDDDEEGVAEDRPTPVKVKDPQAHVDGTAPKPAPIATTSTITTAAASPMSPASQPSSPVTPIYPAPVIKTYHKEPKEKPKEKPRVPSSSSSGDLRSSVSTGDLQGSAKPKTDKEAKEETKRRAKLEAKMLATTDAIAEPKMKKRSPGSSAPTSPISASTPLLSPSAQTPTSTEHPRGKSKGKEIKLEAPAINADDIQGAVFQGWLWKQGGVVKTWKKRWFVLKGPCLYYFPTPAKTRAKGMITLPSYTISPALQANKDFAFQASHPSAKTYTFLANSQHDMQQWIQILSLASQASSVAQPLVGPTVVNDSALPLKLTNKPLPPNAHLIYNIFDVRITRKPNESIGLDIKVNRKEGTVVTHIHEGSPAAETGVIQVGDQIVKIDGKMIAGLKIGPVIDMMKELKDTFVFSFRRL